MSALPPLLMIAEGRRPRLRAAPADRPKEILLQTAVAGLLRRHIANGWVWTHFPAGEARDVRVAAKLKRMGVARGWPDLILLDPRGGLHCLELKRIGGHLSDDQIAFQAWCDGAGVPFAVARTLDEARGVFAGWRCLTEIGGAE